MTRAELIAAHALWGTEAHTFAELIAAGPPGCTPEREWALRCARAADAEIAALAEKSSRIDATPAPEVKKR